LANSAFLANELLTHNAQLAYSLQLSLGNLLTCGALLTHNVLLAQGKQLTSSALLHHGALHMEKHWLLIIIGEVAWKDKKNLYSAQCSKFEFEKIISDCHLPSITCSLFRYFILHHIS
jgi:hypothetical protein